MGTTKSVALFKPKASGISLSEITFFFFFFFFFFSFFESVETVVYDCISPRLFKQHQKSSFNTPFQDQKTYFWDLKCPMLSNRCLLLRAPELNVQIASHTKSLSLCIPRKTRFGHRAHTVLLSDSF